MTGYGYQRDGCGNDNNKVGGWRSEEGVGYEIGTDNVTLKLTCHCITCPSFPLSFSLSVIQLFAQFN